jgi:hypothetical protein
MANQTAGFGFRQAPTVGSTPATGGQAEYKVKSGLGVGIFQNNPVSQQHTAGDDGYLQDAQRTLWTMELVVEQTGQLELQTFNQS